MSLLAHVSCRYKFFAYQFLFSVIGHLFHIYYVPGILLVTGDTAVNNETWPLPSH